MRLPVIETCGECKRFHGRHFGGAGECLHPRAPQNDDNKVNGWTEPPEWCPLPKYTPPTATSTAEVRETQRHLDGVKFEKGTGVSPPRRREVREGDRCIATSTA